MSLATIPTARPRLFRFVLVVVQVLLVVGVVWLHYRTRLHAHRTIPLAERSFFQQCYGTSLSLTAGQGFRAIRLSTSPESQRVQEFLELRRENLSPEELQAFFEHQPPPAVDTDEELILEGTRTLDLRLTAWLWSVFGVHWNVFFTFAAGVSALCCLLVFFMAQRLGGGFLAGLFAALFLTLSPLEATALMRSFRDANPFWFTTLAFFVLVCCTERTRARWPNAAGCILLGAAATLGVGWRPDVLMLVPFLALALIVRLLAEHRPWRVVATALVCFFVGAGGVWAGIRSLCPQSNRSPLTSFHMAYYGEATRCNLLGVEDSLQVLRCDAHTDLTAKFLHAQKARDDAPLEYLGPDYGRVCFHLYRKAVSYNLYHHVRSFPAILWLELRSAAGQPTLPQTSAFYAEPPPPRRLGKNWQAVVETLRRWLPFVFAPACLILWLFSRQRGLALLLGLFTAYYGAVLYFILPETKHVLPLLLPLVVLSGAGLGTLLQQRPRFSPEVATAGRRLLVGGLATLAVWGVACATAYVWSARERTRLVQDIHKAAENGVDEPATIRDQKLFSVQLPADRTSSAFGYLLTVRAGEGNPELVCRQMRNDYPNPPRMGAGGWLTLNGVRLASGSIFGRVGVTRHRLDPGRTQEFFVTCLPAGRYGDPRDFACTVTLRGEGEIVASRRVDLSHWRGLLCTTVVQTEDRAAGAPTLGRLSPAQGDEVARILHGRGSVDMLYFLPRERFTPLGVPLEECLQPGLAPPQPVDLGTSVKNWSSASLQMRNVDGHTILAAEPLLGGFFALSGIFSPEESATYLVRCRYRPVSGDVVFGMTGEEGGAWLSPPTTVKEPDGTCTGWARVTLSSGQRARLGFFCITPGVRMEIQVLEVSVFRET